jgi:hypothetical protein
MKPEEIMHPFYDYSLADALQLATNSKRDQLLRGDKLSEAAALTLCTAEEALEIIKFEVKNCGFNWITGQVALDLLREANGEAVEFLCGGKRVKIERNITARNEESSSEK